MRPAWRLRITDIEWRLSGARLEKTKKYSAPYACGLGMKHRAVAGYLFGVIVNRALEAIMSEASRLGLEDKVMPNDAQGFQIGRASGAVPLLFKPAPFLCGPRAPGGAILSFGHAASKRIRCG
jgi:hypothetical protein